MKLFQIAEALSVVLEINQDDTKRMASFHLDSGGSLDIDVHPDGWDSEHIVTYTAWPFGTYEMREYLDIEDDEIYRETYKTFDEMIQAVKETKNEPHNVQKGRRRCSLSRIQERSV